MVQAPSCSDHVRALIHEFRHVSAKLPPPPPSSTRYAHSWIDFLAPYSDLYSVPEPHPLVVVLLGQCWTRSSRHVAAAPLFVDVSVCSACSEPIN